MNMNFRKWVLDQKLHPDEPVHVDAVHRQLNPIRVLYRTPMDKLYKHFLKPTFVCFSVLFFLIPMHFACSLRQPCYIQCLCAPKDNYMTTSDLIAKLTNLITTVLFHYIFSHYCGVL